MGYSDEVAAPAIVRVESLMKLPKPEKVFSDEDYINIMNKLINNSQYGKLVTIPNRIWMTFEDCIEIWPVPDSEYYA